MTHIKLSSRGTRHDNNAPLTGILETRLLGQYRGQAYPVHQATSCAVRDLPEILTYRGIRYISR